MIDKNYIEEAFEEVISIVEAHIESYDVNGYELVINIENPKELYLFIGNTYTKINYLYKVSRISEKYMYMSLLDFINSNPDFLSDNGISIRFIDEYFVTGEYGANEEFNKYFETVELDYYENII